MYIEDLVSIYKEKQCMTGLSISAWVYILKYIYCDTLPKLHILVPDEVQALAKGHVMPNFTEIGQDDAVYLMPIHWRGYHWALFAFHAIDRTITILDSLKHKEGSRNKLALNFARRLDEAIEQKTGKRPGKLIASIHMHIIT